MTAQVEVDEVTLKLSTADAVAFRFFLEQIPYTDTSKQRVEMVYRWKLIANQLIEQAGYKFTRGILIPPGHYWSDDAGQALEIGKVWDNLTGTIMTQEEFDNR